MSSLSALTLAQVVAFAHFLCIIIAVLRLKYLTLSLKFFASYIFITIIITLIILGFVKALEVYNIYMFFLPFLTYFQVQDTSFLNIFYYLNNTLLLGLFYRSLFTKMTPKQSYKILLITIIVSFFEIGVYIFIDGHNKPGRINPVVDSMFCTGLPLFYLWQWYQNESSLLIKPYRNPYFLISIGLVLQNLLSFLYFLVFEKLFQTDISTYDLFTSIKSLVQLISIFIFLLAFYHSRYAKLIENRGNIN